MERTPEMLGKLRGAFIDMFGMNTDNNAPRNQPRYPYSRPDFLDHNDADLNISSDKDYRPIILPRFFERLPGRTGYAEVVNAGKTSLNEDQAQSKVLLLRRNFKRKRRRHVVQNGVQNTKETGNSATDRDEALPITYFGIFDGHAGTGAAIFARHRLHHEIMDKLGLVRDLLFPNSDSRRTSFSQNTNSSFCHNPGESELVCGALESAFTTLDEELKLECEKFDIPGGCTALAAVFLRNKLYVSNAGDSRGIVVINGKPHQMSHDFTPTSDRRRIQLLAEMRPELLGGEFCPLEFSRRVYRRDINTKLLYRHAHGDGWSVKIGTEEDLRFPLICGYGKKSRLMGTIGVTRGFGDHSLKVFDTELYVKPFLTASPQVKVLDLNETVHGPNDVLIMATDGLWDVCTMDTAAQIVTRTLKASEPDDKNRYMVTAQELVMHARGTYSGNGWQQGEGGGFASGDDISVFVIPLDVHTRAVTAHLHDDLSFSDCPPSPSVNIEQKFE